MDIIVTASSPRKVLRHDPFTGDKILYNGQATVPFSKGLNEQCRRRLEKENIRVIYRGMSFSNNLKNVEIKL